MGAQMGVITKNKPFLVITDKTGFQWLLKLDPNAGEAGEYVHGCGKRMGVVMAKLISTMYPKAYVFCEIPDLAQFNQDMIYAYE